MKDSSIEDVIIEKDYEKLNKKKGKGLIFLVIVILLIVLGGGYWGVNKYYLETIKQSFFKHITNSNLEFFMNNELYSEMINKYTTVNSQIDTRVQFSTTMKNEEYQNIDFSKFLLDLKIYNNAKDFKSYHELGIIYADNDLFSIKAINYPNEFAIISDEIVNKYVGVHKQNYTTLLNRLGLSEWNPKMAFLIKKAITNPEISLTNEEKVIKEKEYIEVISENISDDRFSKQENIAIDKGNETVNVTAYTVSMSQEELCHLIEMIVEKLKTEDALLSELVIDKPLEKNNSQTNTDRNYQIDEHNQAEESNTNTMHKNENQMNMQLDVSSPIDLTPVSSETPEIEIIQNEEELQAYMTSEEETNMTFEEMCIAIILGRRVTGTVQELKDKIDEQLQFLKSEGGNGLTITVYASENGTEKITIILPNTGTVDIEFTNVSQNQNKVKVTYLIEDKEKQYNNNDIIAKEKEINQTEKGNNGFSVEIEKLKNDASTTIRAVYGFIKNEKIYKKISLNAVTEGTIGAKKFHNDLVIAYTSNEGELKTTIDNYINFGENVLVEELTEDNCLFLDDLGEEDFQLTVEDIKNKIKTVYEEKKSSLNLIDMNTQTSIVQQNTNQFSREDVRQALINTISYEMGVALEKGEEYSIQSLEGLQVEGHEVDVEISNDLAKITIDGFVFYIDAEFHLSDEE